MSELGFGYIGHILLMARELVLLSKLSNRPPKLEDYLWRQPSDGKRLTVKAHTAATPLNKTH